jgi:hypothetical protein
MTRGLDKRANRAKVLNIFRYLKYKKAGYAPALEACVTLRLHLLLSFFTCYFDVDTAVWTKTGD